MDSSYTRQLPTPDELTSDDYLPDLDCENENQYIALGGSNMEVSLVKLKIFRLWLT